MEEVANMMRLMAESITRLVEAQAAGAGSKHHERWDTFGKFKNVKVFDGDPKMWDEFAEKFRSQVASGDGKVAELMEAVERMLSEADAETAHWALIADTDYEEEQVQHISVKLYNILLDLTVGDANAMVRRCRGNGLWAWKR